MRSIGVMGKTEEMDSEQLKSKLIFFLVQGVYSVIVCLPTKWLYSSYPLSVLYIASIYLWCIWRGGTYYIEVRPSCQKNYKNPLYKHLFQIFSERYKMKFVAIEKEDHELEEMSFSRENSLENSENQLKED